MATRRGKTSNPVPTATELVDMLEQHADPVDEHNIGTEAFLEVGGTGETRRYRLKPDLDARTRTRIEALAQEYLRQPNATLNILTPSTAQSVDRAVRSSDGWSFDGDAPQFTDEINRHTVEYVADGQTREAMHRSVLALNPRVADVWRLVTASALEAWQPGQAEPPAVWLDVLELLQAMGFEKHHKGGHRQEHVQAAAEAVAALCNLWVVTPMGAKIYPEDGAKKRRKGRVLTAERRSAVLVKLEVDQIRDLFGNAYPMRWHVRAGPWIKDYPRQFAPMLKALVELQATGAVNVWCKALGTELTFLQAEGLAGDPVLTVHHLLERSGLLREVDRWVAARNGMRAREYLERALDQLQGMKLFRAWQYVPDDFQAFVASRHGPRS
ncbi:MAG: hypothetical protein HC933_19865 [Pleurocapsa sp. SU_196_0]|nr:hypothetical protein [Pleurocapsa sp. SU_196_0]